jgi:carboxyl-terminal processing protease
MKRSVLVLICSLFLSAQDNEGSADYFKELSDNIRLYFDVMQTINENYVDTADIEELMSEGIRGMLAATDPYTVLLKDSELDHYNELSTGTYGGIGIHIGTSGPEKRLTVISPMDDTPASKVGLRAGDQLMEIDGKDTKGFSTKDASQLLRGTKGTKVVLGIKRIGSDKILKFSVTRDNINILNIPYSEMFDDSVGYIRLSQFTSTSYSDFVSEFEKLVSSGAKSLIVDLRFNPGGLLESAVKLCGAFLKRNSLAVSTRGRGSRMDSEYKTYMSPLDTEIPLAVLINSSSASASEIFAGSLQDHDRAVIIGEGSFGKGLVQQLFDVGMTKKRNLKMTVRKYYTASGRLIQKDDIFGDNSKNGTDTVFFKTLVNGRKVPSGLGILPDVEIKNKKMSEFIASLKMGNYFGDFVYDLYSKNPSFDYKGTVDEKMIENFQSYLSKNDFEYKSGPETITDSLLSYSKKDKMDSGIIESIENVREAFKRSKENDLKKNIDDIAENLSVEFGVYKSGNKEKYRILNKKDEVIIKAAEILKDRELYSKILGF